MLHNTSTFLTVLFFAILGTADPFSDCLTRQLLSNENGFVVEDATAKLMEGVTQLSIEGLKEEAVTFYMNELVEADCSSVQTSIDSAISTNDPELMLSYLTAALMENIHSFDSVESALVSTGGNRRELFVVVGSIVIGGVIIATVTVGTLATIWVMNSYLHHDIFERDWHQPSHVAPDLHGAPTFHRGLEHVSNHVSSGLSSIFGRRALSGNTDSIVSFSPSDVLQGCANGAPSSVCSLDLAALAGDFSMTLCGGATQAFMCDISVESINAALFEVNANEWSVPLN